MGSSRTSSSGACMKAWTRPTFWRLPLDRDRMRSLKVEVEPIGEQLDALLRHAAAQMGEVRQQFARGLSAIDDEVAGQVTEAPAQRRSPLARVLPEHRRAAAGRADEVHQDADGGRLAGPVGTEEAVDLPLADLEIEAVEPAPAAVVLRQCLGANHVCLTVHDVAEARRPVSEWRVVGNSSAPSGGMNVVSAASGIHSPSACMRAMNRIAKIALTSTTPAKRATPRSASRSA